MWNSRQQRLREERNRKWEMDDRAMVAATAVKASDDLATRVSSTAEVLASKVIETSVQLADTVKKTTEILLLRVTQLEQALHDNARLTSEAKAAAQDAYQEANHVNRKIAALGISIERRKTDDPTIPLEKMMEHPR